MVCEQTRALGSGLFSGSGKGFFLTNARTGPGVFLSKKSACRESPANFGLYGKEQDEETGFYYYGARYLNPKTSVWISADPAMSDYIPSAPVDDEARKRNGNLPGMGGVFNHVNFHVYHYAGNNPVRYTDPDGRFIESILQIIGSALLGAGSSLLQQMWDRVDLSKEESLIGKITSAAVQMFDQASDIVSHIFPGSFDYDAISIAVFAAGGIVTGGLALWSKSSLEFMMAGGLLTGMLVETFDRLLHDRNLSIDEMLKQGFIYAAMPPAMDGAKKFGKIL